MTSPAAGLLPFLQQIPDPRGRKGRRHCLQAMLATVVSATLCGARGCEAFVQWIHLQEPEFWHLLGFTRRPPKKNAFRDLLMALEPSLLEEALVAWTTAVWQADETDSPAPFVSEALPVDSIDGKVLRGAVGPHGRAICLLTRVDQATGRVLSQTPVDAKTNEHKAALASIKQLVLDGQLAGRLIVGDAAFCQRDICRTIDDAGGYYLMDVKENQPTRLRECRLGFGPKRAFSPL